MKHVRQKIREAVATALDGLSPTIYRSRVYPVVTLPAISIYANGERSESENKVINTPRRYTRRLSLVVEVVVEAVTGFDNLVDDYCAQIESAMADDVTLSGYAVDSEMSGTVLMMDGGDTPTAKASITYDIWYRTTGADAETAL